MKNVDKIAAVDLYQENEGNSYTRLVIQLPGTFGYQCFICQCIMVDKGNLRKHCRTKHLKEFILAEKNLKIEKAKENPRGALIKSMITYIESTDNFMCTRCDKITSGKAGKGNMKKHIISIHMPQEYEESKECNLCRKILKNTNSLAAHISINHRGTVEKCEICNMTLKTQKSLSKHMKIVHQMKLTRPRFKKKAHVSSYIEQEDLFTVKKETEEDYLLIGDLIEDYDQDNSGRNSDTKQQSVNENKLKQDCKALVEKREDQRGDVFHYDLDPNCDTKEESFVELKLEENKKENMEKVFNCSSYMKPIPKPEEYMVNLTDKAGFKCYLCGKLCFEKRNLKKHVLGKHILNYKPDLDGLFIRIDDDNVPEELYKCLKCPKKLAQETGMRKHIIWCHSKYVYKSLKRQTI
jgi:hypothetical protein